MRLPRWDAAPGLISPCANSATPISAAMVPLRLCYCPINGATPTRDQGSSLRLSRDASRFHPVTTLDGRRRQVNTMYRCRRNALALLSVLLAAVVAVEAATTPKACSNYADS